MCIKDITSLSSFVDNRPLASRDCSLLLHGSPILSFTPAALPGLHQALAHILFLMGGALMAFSSTTTVVLCDSSTVVPWNPTLSFHGICGPQGYQLTSYAGLRLPSRMMTTTTAGVIYFKICMTTNAQNQIGTGDSSLTSFLQMSLQKTWHFTVAQAGQNLLCSPGWPRSFDSPVSAFRVLW